MALKLKRVVVGIVVALIMLGIGYNFILPFTPIWFDVVAWSAIGLAFLVGAYIVRTERDSGDGDDGST